MNISENYIIRFVLAMFDATNSGAVDIHQFNKMFEYINQWLNIFKTYDRNGSGLIDDQELNQGEYSVCYVTHDNYLILNNNIIE